MNPLKHKNETGVALLEPEQPNPSVTLDIEHSENFLAEADAAYARNDLRAACASLKKGLGHTPDSIPMLVCLGNIQFQTGEFSEAVQSFQLAAELSPDDADVLLRLASTAHRCHNSALFDQTLTRLLELDPGNSEAMRLSINHHLEQGRFAEGAQQCCALIGSNPDDLLLLLQFGKCLREINDLISARWCYERALQVDANCAIARDAISQLPELPATPTQAMEISRKETGSRDAEATAAARSAAELLDLSKRMPSEKWLAAGNPTLIARIKKIVDRVRPYTMVPDEAVFRTIELTLEAVRTASENDVIAECGTWKGGCSLAMILAQKEFFGTVKHPVWMFDSYEGLPDITREDGCLAVEWQERKDLPTYFDNCTAHVEEVLAMMKREAIEESSYRIFKGWFNQTVVPAAEELDRRGSQLALLRLDGDWYESTRDCLNALFPKLRKGAPCIVDDYYAWDGCALALHEYFGHHRIAARIRTMPVWQGAYLFNKIREAFEEI